jgi:hypothetical protein
MQSTEEKKDMQSTEKEIGDREEMQRMKREKR